jgi:hypothetical protein
MTAAIETAIERLSEQLAGGYSAEFRSVLAFFGKFHRYSWQNALLILSQLPEASLVAGMTRWNELGYQVRKGERSIWIWAPITKKVTNEQTGEDVEGLVGFRPAPVFDASQLANLDDRPLPALWRPLPDDMGDLY